MTTIGILTVSDRASRGDYQDLSGPAAEQWLSEHAGLAFRSVRKIVPDESQQILAALIEFSDHQHCALVITTGGTGPAPRDVTPEATQEVCHRLLPGIPEAMRGASIAHVPTAMLSRAVAGIRHQTLIVNLPGNPKAIAECLGVIWPAAAHCLNLLGHKIASDPARHE